jgi:hypothetical protein
MVKKKSLPDEPDNWYLVGDSERDIDLTKHKASEKEEWLNYDIGNPDFQRLFRRVKGFYRGSCTVPVYVPDDLAPFLDRAMEKFKFSSKYEALLYVLTLRSCEYVADFISGTMYDYAVDHALKDLSYDELKQSYNILEEDEDREKSFKDISCKSALSIASFLKYITGNLSVPSQPKEKFSSHEHLGFLEDPPDKTVEFSIKDLHMLAVIFLEYFPGKQPSEVFKNIADIQEKQRLEESFSSLRAQIKELTEENAELRARLSHECLDCNGSGKIRVLVGSGLFRSYNEMPCKTCGGSGLNDF